MAIMQQTCQSCERQIPMGIGICPYCQKPVPSQGVMTRQMIYGLLFMAGLVAFMLIHRALTFG